MFMYVTDKIDHVEHACQVGVDLVQFRNKDYHLALKFREITRKYNTKLLINDRFDIALAVDADGVHCKEQGLSPKDVPSHLTIGVSTHSLASAQRAEQEGAHYIIFGPIFHKPSYPPQGLDKLRTICQSVKIPVLAIGGVTSQNAPHCFECGAQGIAVCSRILEFTPSQIKSFQKGPIASNFATKVATPEARSNGREEYVPNTSPF